MSDSAEDKGQGTLRKTKPFTLPPAGFDARRASERELVVYGLPPRPKPETHPVMAARWERIAGLARKFVTPELRPLPFQRPIDHGLMERRAERERALARYSGKAIESGRGNHLPDPTKPGTPMDRLSLWRVIRVPFNLGDLLKLLPETSGNWSGAWVARPDSEPINSVSGEWTIPSVNPPAQADGTLQDGTYICLAWVGIDGTNGSNDVLQAGTGSQCVVSGGNVTSTRFFAWKEWYSLPWEEVGGFTVSAGDQIACTVCAPFSNTHGAALFNNLTTGQVTSVPIDPPAGVSLVGNAAEWIIEDPTQSSGALFPFPVYSGTTFTGCTAGTKDIELYAGDGQDIDMVQGGVTLSTGLIEGKTTVYCHYGP